MSNSVIIVGASSGIGEALARRFAESGYEVGMTARRLERLQSIGDELPTRTYVAGMDVTETETARDTFEDLVDSMEGVDIVVVSAGIAPANKDLEWEIEEDTIETNVSGFVALATAAVNVFEEQGHGHLVGISSVSAHVGLKEVPAYSASKAFVSRYLEALRFRTKVRDADVTVTTIEPGYVDTKLSLGGLWETTPEVAAGQIFDAVEKGRKRVYVTRRWRLVVWLMTLFPEAIKRRLV